MNSELIINAEEPISMHEGEDIFNDQRNKTNNFDTKFPPWFNWDYVSDFEKISVPEFFQDIKSSKSPEIYLIYRNFMIEAYKSNPHEYLAYTTCRFKLTGDAGGILRIHEFLEKQSIINCSSLVEKPNVMNPKSTSHFLVFSDTISGLQNTIVDPIQKKSELISPLSEKQWSKEEILLLFTAIEKYRDDWNKIAAYVGTRDQKECITQFLTYPIEDHFFNTKVLEAELLERAGQNNYLSPILKHLQSVKEKPIVLTPPNLKQNSELQDIKNELSDSIRKSIKLEIEKFNLKLQQYCALENLLKEERIKVAQERNNFYHEKQSLERIFGRKFFLNFLLHKNIVEQGAFDCNYENLNLGDNTYQLL